MQRLRFLSHFALLLAIAPASGAGAMDHSGETASPDSRDRCPLYMRMALEGKFPAERNFAYRALARCPRNDGVATGLEKRLEQEPSPSREAILEGLEGQGSKKNLKALLKLYDGHPGEKERIGLYRDLRTIAEPELRAPLFPIFLRGLHSDSTEIQRESLLGLGKIGAREAAVEILPYYRHPDRDLVLAALEAAGQIDTEELVYGCKPLLRSRDREIQRRSIHLYGRIGTAKALDALVELEQDGILPDNSAELWSTIGTLQEKLMPGWETATAIDFARIRSSAASDANVTAIVRPGTTLFVRKSGDTLHRRPYSRSEPMDTWLEVRSGDGLSGFVTSSSLRLYDTEAEP